MDGEKRCIPPPHNHYTQIGGERRMTDRATYRGLCYNHNGAMVSI